MNLAVMQPYLFPYIGYYQLVYASKTFIFYDDVSFIKNGYINRNNILANGKAQRFTIPVPGSSSNKLINQLSFEINIKKTLKSIQQSYRKAPYYNDVYPIVESVLISSNRNVAYLCAQSIMRVFEYLGLKRTFLSSSALNFDKTLPAAAKLIEMAKLTHSQHYINSAGGKALYSKEYFAKHSLKLSFIEMDKLTYEQNACNFVPHLSMIDVLMWNNKEQVKQLLTQYRLV